MGSRSFLLSAVLLVSAACDSRDKPVSPEPLRVLIVGPEANAVASHLQAMLDADGAVDTPIVLGQDTTTGTDRGGRVINQSLMSFYYFPHRREERLASLAED